MNASHSQKTPPAGASMSADNNEERPTTLDLRGGGWVFVAAFALAAIVCIVQIAKIPSQLRWRDGEPPPPSMSNGFDLHTARVPVGLIAVYRPKDGMEVMKQPGLLDSQAMREENRSKYTRYLIADDRVVGVSLNGESRAYPIRVLTYHEAANDILGGVPIVVTYCPISGSAVAYDRRLNGETLLFGMSGLIYNSNILLYDQRKDEPLESLWCQMTGTPVQGVASGRGTLTPIQSQVMQWKDWYNAHPETTVIAGDPRLKRQYRTDPYLTYPSQDGVSKFPVDPRLPKDAGHTKELMLIVRTADGEEVLPARKIAENVDASGSWRTHVGSTPVTIHFRQGRTAPPVTWVDATDPDRPIESSQIVYRFVWYAHTEEREAAVGGDEG